MSVLMLVVGDERDVEDLFRQQFRRELRLGVHQYLLMLTKVKYDSHRHGHFVKGRLFPIGRRLGKVRTVHQTNRGGLLRTHRVRKNPQRPEAS